MNEHPPDVLVHRLFESQAARTPDAIALIEGDKTIDFQTLNRQADALAAQLISMGLRPRSFAGLCCERSADMVLAALAILKAGAAYIPIDPAYPKERIDFILSDTAPPLIATQRPLAGRFAEARLPVICVDTPTLERSSSAASLPAPQASDSPFCVLYTSGSTGKPKGVVIPHFAIWNRLDWARHAIPYSAKEVACARTTLGFVDSVAEIFAPLAFGIPLVIIGQEAQRDPAIMLAELAARGVTRIVLVPSLLSTILELYPDIEERLPHLRYWFLGGEPVPIALVEAFKRLLPGRKLINLYGATEVCGDATTFDFDDMPESLKNSPIGYPVSRSFVRVLDENLRELPHMEEGEVCVSGACLSLGYLNRPDLNAAKFAQNPFREGGKLYRTGDRGRALACGAIEYLGRVDQLVKIRGMRVELGEVEANLLKLPGLTQAVAVVDEDDAGRKTLAAFYRSKDVPPPTPETLRKSLATLVPDYMIPSRFVAVDEFPQNANGKVDRKALQAIALRFRNHPAEPPETKMERRLTAIWEFVLTCGPIGRNEHFLDLGGHSLAAARIAGLLRDEFGRPIPIGAVLQFPTVAALANHLVKMPEPTTKVLRRDPIPISGRPLPPELPLSLPQFPFWFFHALTKRVNIVSEAFLLPCSTEIAVLRPALSETITAFDALWLAIPRWKPVQRVRPRRKYDLLISDHRGSARTAADVLRAEADANNSAPFDLMQPPHIHARLVLLPDDTRFLLVAMPHIVVDMASMELFRRRLQEAFDFHTGNDSRKERIPAATANLADLISWERRGGRATRIADDIRYWSGVAAGPALNHLPGRFFEPRGPEGASAFSMRQIPAENTQRMRDYAQRHGQTLPIVLAGAVAAGLSRATASQRLDLLVMLEKRERPELRALFANQASMMRLRVDGRAGTNPTDLVEHVGQQLLTSYEHTDYLMEYPTLINDFWLDAPAPLKWLVRRSSVALAAAWPHAQLEPELIAQMIFAYIPNPVAAVKRALTRLAGRTTGQSKLITLNIFPEIYDAAPQGVGNYTLLCKRGLELVVKPTDFIVGHNPMLALTLQVHICRDAQGLLVVNLYGGGLSQNGLDTLSDGILAATNELCVHGLRRKEVTR